MATTTRRRRQGSVAILAGVWLSCRTATGFTLRPTTARTGRATASARDAHQATPAAEPSRGGRPLFADGSSEGSTAVATEPKRKKVVKPWFTKAQETVDYSNVEAMYVRHILVQTEGLAKTCLEQIREGADFGELASSISDCQATRAKGGEVNTPQTMSSMRHE
ncbi:unnamed protein product, partial [Ectocarpus sp. 12 AP-2014]